MRCYAQDQFNDFLVEREWQVRMCCLCFARYLSASWVGSQVPRPINSSLNFRNLVSRSNLNMYGLTVKDVISLEVRIIQIQFDHDMTDPEPKLAGSRIE